MALDPTAITRGDTITMETPDGRRWSGQVQDVTHGPGGSYEITVTQTDAIPKAVRDLLEDPNDMAQLTPAGSEAIALAAFANAEVALFDGPDQVTPWEPYDPAVNTPVTAPRRLGQASVSLRTPGGTWMSVPANSIVEAGDTVALPPPSGWFVSDDRPYHSLAFFPERTTTQMPEYSMGNGLTVRLDNAGGLIWMTLVDRDGQTLVNRVLEPEEAGAIAAGLTEEAARVDSEGGGRVDFARVLRQVLGE